MIISDKGLALIQEFESYLKPQQDGSCKAYKCPAGVWTIGFGCTEGVTADSHWTREEADNAFRREMDKHEKIVNRLVTVPITQSQFDALVSFNYNCGALAKSTLLKKLNKRDYLGAADEFRYFTKARNPKTGKKEVLNGLVRRRKAEAAMFTSDMPGADEMPQAAVESRPISVIVKENKEAVVGGFTTAGVIGKAVTDAVSSPPAEQPRPQVAAPPPKPTVKDQLDKAKEIKQQTEVAKEIGTFAYQTYEWVKGPGMYPALFVVVPLVTLLLLARKRSA